MDYLGKPLSDYSLWDLGKIEEQLLAAEAKREVASKHSKFNEDRELNGKKIPKMEFPPPNPAFVKLKEAIQNEINSRNK